MPLIGYMEETLLELKSDSFVRGKPNEPCTKSLDSVENVYSKVLNDFSITI